ncbi:MAG: hypothetical protein IPJ33_18065 [Gammaproteobacteria bacterium]|nr:hypothetical protein [Gammaproteobacteria bacterium]MBP6051446.1 hypothetical protein [Pseudomonadales bacterium]MBK7171273.1 hypothetical protein [Gammaproteobacteria bacterium]MBK7518911.1 hypothetical protein [Gammaproteobacteria bacterium]MBK7730347.1 hypothetical protein [Gammaproteobacteria bacterium]
MNKMLLPRNLWLAAIGTVLGLQAAVAAEDLNVRDLMSADEFRAAGLEQLSQEEITALNAWLLRYTAKEAPILRTSNEVVREEVRKVEAEVIRSRIDGDFAGWSGKTVFVLQNGQAWQQRMGGSWRHHANAPEVEIRKNFMGFWEMKMVDGGRLVGVKRLR